MQKEFIFVTGFFGAPIESTAAAIAEEKSAQLIFLDEEISKADGRSIRRLCMMMGEHEYRNKEYEALETIITSHTKSENKAAADITDDASQSDLSAPGHDALTHTCTTLVICCGDGVLHDDMSRQLILHHTLVIVGSDMTVDELWQNAKKIEDSYHAFMTLKDEQRKLDAFQDLYQRQLLLYDKYR